MLFLMGNREGLSELVLRGGLGGPPAEGLWLGRGTLEMTGRWLDPVGLSTLRSSHLDEQRKTVGRPSRPLRGEAP